MHERRMLLAGGMVLSGDAFVRADLLVAGGKIGSILPPGAGLAAVGGISSMQEDCEVIDAAGMRILPGFIDIHTHGGSGVDFNHASPDEVRHAARFFAAQGVTGFLPTILTDDPDTMLRQLAIVSDPAVLRDCPHIMGVHLEGPFLCPLYKGAQPERYLRTCDLALFSRFQEAARGSIRLVTLAPEVEGAEDLTRALTVMGVRVSVGHSAASYEQAMAVIRAGAVSATHVMNAMKLLHMHDPAILTAVLESDIYGEMICDGFHLYPPIVRLLLKIKGRDRMIAVTDSIMAAGLPDGEYHLGVNDVVVRGGDAKLASNGMRAGSTLTMKRAVRNIGEYSGLGLEGISRLVSENPARMLGVVAERGTIAPGTRADLVLLDPALEVAMTISAGQVLFRR